MSPPAAPPAPYHGQRRSGAPGEARHRATGARAKEWAKQEHLPQRVGSGCNASKSSRPIMLSEQPPLMVADRLLRRGKWFWLGHFSVAKRRSTVRPSSKLSLTPWHNAQAACRTYSSTRLRKNRSFVPFDAWLNRGPATQGALARRTRATLAWCRTTWLSRRPERTTGWWKRSGAGRRPGGRAARRG